LDKIILEVGAVLDMFKDEEEEDEDAEGFA